MGWRCRRDVLPQGQCMNRLRYQWVIAQKFPGWIKASFGVQKRGVFLVQDHERCLWCMVPREAMRDIGVVLLENYPKCSQDLNPLETVWRDLRRRLSESQPATLEGRDEFISRLWSAVAWLNRTHVDLLHRLCNCQTEWAQDVRAQHGGRTQH